MNLPDLPKASRSRITWLHGCVCRACFTAIDSPVTRDALVAFVSEAALRLHG